MTANSSVNFVIYCVFRRQFRRRLYACCCSSQLAKRRSSSIPTEFYPLHTPAAVTTSGHAHQLPVNASWTEMLVEVAAVNWLTSAAVTKRQWKRVLSIRQRWTLDLVTATFLIPTPKYKVQDLLSYLHTNRRTFPVLRSTCSWRVTIYVRKPSAIGQSTRPT